MDKSKQYIQMCQTSKEIQNAWHPKTGDFYSDTKGNVNCWTPKAKGAEIIKKGFGVVTQNNVTTLSRLVWLPALDQLIDLSQTTGKGFRDITFDFYEWIKKPYSQNTTAAEKLFSSQEQLWLAFVMATKFNKYWSEHRWS